MPLANSSSFDVIVIGSGPAGCAAATTCHKTGLNVLLITQEKEHDESSSITKQPAESIHPGVVTLLEKIGAGGVVESAIMGTYSGIYSGNVYRPLGEDPNGKWQGFHINRKIFNSNLLNGVSAQGVHVKWNTTIEDFIIEKNRVVGVKTEATEIRSRYIIDASGKKALAGKKLNLQQQFFSPPLLCWTGVSGEIESYPFDAEAAHFIAGDEGWSWLAPQPPHQCTWTRLTMKSEKSFSPPDALKSFPVAGEIQFANMRWRMHVPVCKEGLVLCGDAAGVLDPAAGQGIFNALWSGMSAAKAVVLCVQQPALEAFHLASYNDWFGQQFEMKVDQLKAYYTEQGLKSLMKEV